MRNEFETFYIGESFGTYVDIAVRDLWETSAILSEPRDRAEYDLVRINSNDYKKVIELSQNKKLTSYEKALKEFKSFAFMLNFDQRKVLLGRSREENFRELSRHNFISVLNIKKKADLLRSAFNTIFWNHAGNETDFLEIPYWYHYSADLYQLQKENYCQNNGNYLRGKLKSISLKENYAVVDSIWGKCFVKKFKTESIGRLRGLDLLEEENFQNCFELIRMDLELEKTLEFIPQIYVDIFLKDQWIPFSELRVEKNKILFDIYLISDLTLTKSYLRKICKALFAKLNRELNLPLKVKGELSFTYRTSLSGEVFNNIKIPKKIQQIKIS